MSDEGAEHDRFVERLLQEDARRAAGPSRVEDGLGLLERLLDEEMARERRVRRAAIAAWGFLVLLAPLGGVTMYLQRMGSDRGQEIGRAGFQVITWLAAIAAALGILMTVAWLFRSRSVSLGAIERRLARLEGMINGSG